MRIEKAFEKQKLILAADLLGEKEVRFQFKELIEAYFAQQELIETMMIKQLGLF